MEIDPAAPTGEPDPLVTEYNGYIAEYDRAFKDWQKRGDRVIKRYRVESQAVDNGGDAGRFNILWSNVQLLIPATYSKLPKPDVTRRFRDNDPVARVAATILERALDFEIQQYPDYAATMNQVVQDRFLPGRGTAWVRYEPHFRAVQQQMPTDGVQITEDTDTPQEELDFELSPVDYVSWKDFGHSVARTWEEVTCVWRIVYMDEAAVTERFGDEWAKKLPYDASPERKDKAVAGNREPKQTRVYEIWNKEKKTACWMSKALGQVLDERDDPLGLQDFFPCPRPLYATITNETLVPIPDYVQYEDQAIELNTLAERIHGLIKAMQVKGVYDASVPELKRLFTEAGNTDLIPVKNFASFAEKQGLRGSMELVDLAPIASALKECFGAVDHVKELIYEITGISDILRGATDSSETLGAQQMKQSNAGMRLGKMQKAVACFAAELLSIKAQVMCAKYSPETLVAISAAAELSAVDQQVVPQALALLIGPERMADPEAVQGPNPTRRFRIDIEADSLVKMDENQEKQDRLDFLDKTGAFLEKALPIIQEAPQAGPLIISMLKFGVTAFAVGKTIEGEFDAALDQMKAAAANPQPKPNPEMMRIQAEQASQQARAQADAQATAAKLQFEQQRFTMEQQAEQIKLQNEAQLAQFKAQLEAHAKATEMSLEQYRIRVENETKIAVAEIAAKASLTTATISANASADPANAGELDGEGKPQAKSSLAALVDSSNSQLQALLDGMNALAQGQTAIAQSHQNLVQHLAKPRVVTLPDGRQATLQ